MVKYIIVFKQPVRLCLDIVESIGPFDSLDKAKEYRINVMSQWAIIPDCYVISMGEP